MKKILTLLISLSLIWISGCATQGLVTYRTFEQSDDYESLNKSMDALKTTGRDGSGQQQFSALKNLRYISKYMPDTGKREMAIQALAFLAWESKDGDVRASSRDRIENILEDDSWEITYKVATVDALGKLLAGKTGYVLELNGTPMMIPMEVGEREDILDFLLDEFSYLPLYSQYFAIDTFRNILLTPATLDNCPLSICEKDDRQNVELWETSMQSKWSEELQDLKFRIWEKLPDLFEKDYEFIIKAKIALLVAEIENYYLYPEMEEKFVTLAREWNENQDIPESVRSLIIATRERKQNYGVPASKEPVIEPSAYKDLLTNTSEFLETHLDSILFQQILVQERKMAESSLETPESDIPYTKIEDGSVSGGSDTSSENKTQNRRIPALDVSALLFNPLLSEDLLKREIVLLTIAGALRQGLILENQDLEVMAQQKLEEDGSLISIYHTTEFAKELFPSLKHNELDPIPLIDTLIGKSQQTDSVLIRRMYLNAVANGVSVYPTLVRGKIDALPMELDVGTRYQINEILARFDKTQSVEINPEDLIDKPEKIQEEAPAEVIEVVIPDANEEIIPDEGSVPVEQTLPETNQN
ncbi:MAG: hypothetical protein HQM11_04705 [SAR324 cluster bacterium]|nr:hypothetical protein [SAR324 cluster bacterium]